MLVWRLRTVCDGDSDQRHTSKKCGKLIDLFKTKEIKSIYSTWFGSTSSNPFIITNSYQPSTSTLRQIEKGTPDHGLRDPHCSRERFVLLADVLEFI